MNRLIFLLSSLILFMTACNTDLPLPAPSAGKLVVIGELAGNDTVFLRAGQSVGLQSPGAVPELLENLQISLRDSSTGSMSALLERSDFRSSFLYTLPFSAPVVLSADRRYTVTAKHPERGEVSAAVYIPPAFTATLAGTVFADYRGDSVLRFDIDINDPRAAQSFYVLEVVQQEAAISGYFVMNGVQYDVNQYRYRYDSLRNAGAPTNGNIDTTYLGETVRQMAYTTDPLTDNSGSTIKGDGLYRRIFLSGKAFGGTTHRTQILVPRRSIYGYWPLFMETIVRVKSVAPDYYTFLKAYEQYDPSSDLTENTGPVNLPGNVKGGLGMVGGVFRQEVKVVY